jgi:hypothetical protein
MLTRVITLVVLASMHTSLYLHVVYAYYLEYSRTIGFTGVALFIVFDDPMTTDSPKTFSPFPHSKDI